MGVKCYGFAGNGREKWGDGQGWGSFCEMVCGDGHLRLSIAIGGSNLCGWV